MADNSFPVVVGLGLLGVAALGFINSNKAGEETSSSSLGFSPFDSSSYGSSGSTSGVSGAVSGGGTGTVTNPAVNPGLVQGYAPQQNYAAENAAGYDAAAFAFAPTSKQATLDPAGEVTQQSGSSGAKLRISAVQQGTAPGKGVTDVVLGSVREAEIYSAVKPVTDVVTDVGSVVGSVFLPTAAILGADAFVDYATGGALPSVTSEKGKSNLAANVAYIASNVEKDPVGSVSSVVKTTAAVVNPIGTLAGNLGKAAVETVSSWLGGLFK